MSEFAIGQRWLSETETELGLGIVVNIDYRLVTVFFPAADEERTYSKSNAPLSRMTFAPGDTIQTQDGQSLVIRQVQAQRGVLQYLAAPEEEPDALRAVPESQLAFQVELSSVTDRLFSKQLDSSNWFNLRVAALYAQAQSENSPVRGLRGPRVDLIPHQLWIASEVGRRRAPRVLLADEVGLGKTIEAGLILHQQLVTERAQRVLILVPGALVHQWFVEMVRRFNLHFSLFDEARLAALRQEDEDGPQDNPFLSEQLVLCSTDFLARCDLEALLDAHWDLLVVDEAHHLEWSEQAPSPLYQRVASLARQARGLLLLTATPEQLGMEGHFARLHLLDPDRFHDLAAFREEQTRYQDVARLAAALMDRDQWDPALREALQAHLPEQQIDPAHRQALLSALLDRSGTGRVLFRNTRRNVKGFPERHLFPIPLEPPRDYQGLDDQAPLSERLYPESVFSDDRWCEQDPRVAWLVQFLRKERRRKVLVICARKDTAIDLHAWCGYKQGMNVALFHEDMDLIERDRAAAYFADLEDGAQALFCSEIGSEGRNFQFAHDLVLLDLPSNPDLLEQRIGRLDRIGQTRDVNLHVPYFTGHAQEVLFRWYHEGMQAFTRTNPAGRAILQATREQLDACLRQPRADTVNALVHTTATLMEEMISRLEQGRDRLLELNSSQPERAEELIRHLQDADATPPREFMERTFERFGVDTEEHSEQAQVLRPGSHLMMPFPHLPEEGVTITYDRHTALSRDDMLYLTWEHPMVTGAIDLVLGDDFGKAAVALLRNPRVKAGTLLVELIYSLRCAAPRALQVERFLPVEVLRSLLDAQGRDLSGAISHEGLSRQCHKMDKALARKVIDSQQPLLETMLAADLKRVQAEATERIEAACQRAEREFVAECQRLQALKRVNPMIRDQDLLAQVEEGEEILAALQDTRVQLAAVRVIVAGNA